jgi:hypothetical protein
MSISRLTDEMILALAPCHLANRNPQRYQGQFERVMLDAFAPEDRSLLVQVYGILLDLYQTLRPVHGDPFASHEVLDDFVHAPPYRDLAVTMSHLGHATSARGGRSQDVDRLVHDLRGGAFQALSFRLQLFEFAPERMVSLQDIYFLVRDHLKIMRNCVADLDSERFEADLKPVDHDVDLLVEKWSQPEFNGAGTSVQIDLHCGYAGTLCESCMEFSSLDRIIYNLMNNAARYSSDFKVHFFIAGIPGAVRFVVANAVTPEHRRMLVESFGDHPGELFRGGFTTGGHGVGARICADFCAHAFGISDFDEALQGGYFGACWIGDYFAAWFHWPIVPH